MRFVAHRIFEGLDIGHFWGLGGPGGPGDPRKRWGASPPTFPKVLQGPTIDFRSSNNSKIFKFSQSGAAGWCSEARLPLNLGCIGAFVTVHQFWAVFGRFFLGTGGARVVLHPAPCELSSRHTPGSFGGKFGGSFGPCPAGRGQLARPKTGY